MREVAENKDDTKDYSVISSRSNEGTGKQSSCESIDNLQLVYRSSP
jgi:hypothetical protein